MNEDLFVGRSKMFTAPVLHCKAEAIVDVREDPSMLGRNASTIVMLITMNQLFSLFNADCRRIVYADAVLYTQHIV